MLAFSECFEGTLCFPFSLRLIEHVHTNPLLQFLFLLPHTSHPSVTTDPLALFCVIALTQASWSAPIVFCLLALPHAHHTVRKPALFLAPIRSYLKSPSQTCNCNGLGWRPPDFQLRQQPRPLQTSCGSEPSTDGFLCCRMSVVRSVIWKLKVARALYLRGAI